MPLVGWFARIEISGQEHLPEEGPYVLAPNHYSEFDPLIVAVATWRVGRAPRFMAKESLFRVPVLGTVLRSTGMIPVGRASSSAAARQSLEQSQALVRDGRGVIVYPEGTLTREPNLWPMRGKTGAARLALAGDIPVIPAATWGVQQIMPRYGRLRVWPPRARVRLRFGPPVNLDEWRVQNSPAALAAATDAIMAAIADQLGTLRGETPPPERWNPADHGQTESGRLES